MVSNYEKASFFICYDLCKVFLVNYIWMTYFRGLLLRVLLPDKIIIRLNYRNIITINESIIRLNYRNIITINGSIISLNYKCYVRKRICTGSNAMVIYMYHCYRWKTDWIKQRIFFHGIRTQNSDTRQTQSKGNGAQPWQMHQKRIMSTKQSTKEEVLRRPTRHMISTRVTIPET